MDILTAITEATCGEACWHAREDVCRCSCDGANHGALRSANGEQPARTSKLDGYVYQLAAVADNRTAVYDQAAAINSAAGPRQTVAYGDWSCAYPWRETDKGAPARVKAATRDQAERWPELTAYRNLDAYDWYRHGPYLLWTRDH